MSLLLLLWVGACGGRSVARTGATETGENDASGPISTLEGCAALCEQCGLDRLVDAHDCALFCADLERQASAADCDAALGDFVGCRNARSDACALRSCPDETNNLTVCVLSYCDDHAVSARALCSPW
jgi:hypothetical protein